MMNKQQIRSEMKQFLAALSTEDRHARSHSACAHLAGTYAFRHSQTIMLYLSMPGEMDTATLALTAWEDGKSVVVPRMDWESKRMVPIEICSLDAGFETVGPGVRQPIEGKKVSLGIIDLIVIPGLAFDRHGYRVGRGKGFYDRFLAQREFAGTRCGLCFHEQMLSETIPNEPHDVPMDVVVTDREMLQIHPFRGRDKAGSEAGRSDR
jgi:5-formyltetrahydrofolate cyclo-ligase